MQWLALFDGFVYYYPTYRFEYDHLSIQSHQKCGWFSGVYGELSLETDGTRKPQTTHLSLVTNYKR